MILYIQNNIYYYNIVNLQIGCYYNILYYFWIGIVVILEESVGHLISFDSNEKQFSALSLYKIRLILSGVGYT